MTKRFIVPALFLFVSLLSASLFLPAQAPAQGHRVCFYEHINYQGRSACWEPGSEVPDLTQLWHQNMGWNDVISSISLEGYATATIYEHINYGGASVYIGTNIPDMRYLQYDDGSVWNWNDVVSSLIVY